MLTPEQDEALKKAESIFYEYSKQEPSQKNYNLLRNAFEILAEFVDDTDNIYYRAFFAEIIQTMQDTNEFELSEDCQSTKILIFKECLIYVYEVKSIDIVLGLTLCNNLISLGLILLQGIEEPQDYTLAHMSFDFARTLSLTFNRDTSALDEVLSHFHMSEDGSYMYKGV